MNVESPWAIFGSPMPAEAVSSIQNTVVRLATKMMRLVEPKISFHELYFREHSKIVRAAVKMPLAYLGGAKSVAGVEAVMADGFDRSEEHTSELQSLMRISYAVFCLKKKTNNTIKCDNTHTHSYMHKTYTTQ